MDQSTTFMPTGSLGTGSFQPDNVRDDELSSQSEQTLASADVLPPQADASTRKMDAYFVPNGLLSRRTDDDVENEREYSKSGSAITKNECIFVPNGFLSASSEEQQESHVLNEATVQIRNDTNFIFSSSNLLNQRVEMTADEDSNMKDSQEERLPDIRNFLHKYRKDDPPLASTSTSTSSHIPVGSISGTTHDGKPLYLRRKPKSKTLEVLEGRPRISTLLETPIHKLRQQLTDTVSSISIGALDSNGSSDAQLWVDRYRPVRFTDLCGDERVHRETMAWLKEWDTCVFGKTRSKKAKKTSREDAASEFDYKDPYYRPLEKILLLGGPAGFGKTTLAHIAAKQAGYDVIEINASDARSGQVIDERIRPTLESGSAIGSKKPVCLVIDEIDGATGAGDNPSGFVQKLVGLTFEGLRKKSRDNSKGKDKRPLLRPIICICNDIYASALTKLRQYSRIIRFTRPADLILTKRLRWICENEGLKADSRALSTLIGIAKGDMRGCLNTLQFIRAMNKEVTEPMIRSATVGMKEAEASFSTTLSSLFVPTARKRVKELGITEEEENKYVTRLSRDLEDHGSLDRLALGCFEHYTKLRHADANLERHYKASEWLTAFDTFSGTMRSEREYGLLPYLSYLLVPFYHLFNERGGPKPERPIADWENLVKTKAKEEIYKSMRGCLQSLAGHTFSGIRHLLANENLQLEFAPYINRIISPPMKPVNNQVTRPQDRAVLMRLVEIMVLLELRLVQEKAEDGQLVYLLDPPIDAFVTYDSKRASDIPVVRYATRHLIAGEIDAQIIHRQADAVEKDSSSRKKLDIFSRNRKGADDAENSTPAYENTVNKKRKASELDIADRPPVDFFGRLIESTAPELKKLRVQESSASRAYRVSFRYNEGNSAAVRKPIKVSSFM